MKKILLVAVALCLLLVGCKSKKNDIAENADGIFTEATTLDTQVSDFDAVRIAEKHWGIGIANIDPETGNTYDLVIEEMPSDTSRAYKVVLKWYTQELVWEDLKAVSVNADTGEITPIN